MFGPLVGLSLGESRRGERTELTVVGVEEDGRLVTDPEAETRVSRGSVLLAIGSEEQVREFWKLHG